MHVKTLLTSAFVAAIMSSVANAGTLVPDYSVSAAPNPSQLNYQSGNGGVFIPNLVTSTGTTTFNYANSSVTDIINIGPSPSVTAYGHSDEHALAQAELIYYFRIDGAAGSVPVLVQAAGSISNANEAAFQVDSTNVNDSISPHIAGLVSGGGNQSFAINQTYNLQANQVYRVYLMADGVAQFGSSFSATVDPTFTIDPSFSERYNLVFSEGIQNGIGAVPEPSTWALLILGFAGVGFMAYRRRKTAALVACAMLVANLPSVSHAEVILPGQVVTATFDVPNDFSFAFMSIQTGYNSNLNPPTTYALNVYDALQNNVFSATGNPGFTTSQGFMAPNTIDSSHFTIVIDQVVGAFNLDVINVLFSNSGNFNPVGAFGQNVAPNLGVGSPFAISAAVPEPSTWAMLLIGCAGVGFMAYRRRSQSVALSAT